MHLSCSLGGFAEGISVNFLTMVPKSKIFHLISDTRISPTLPPFCLGFNHASAGAEALKD